MKSETEQEDIEHECTDEITCPYCGRVHGDSFEAPDDGVLECYRCKRSFRYCRNITVDYSTEKLTQ